MVFILLGVEILLENHKGRTEDKKVVYDFAAIFMMAAMMCFAMVMAVIDYAMRFEGSVYFW